MDKLVIIVDYVIPDENGVGHQSQKTYIFDKDSTLSICLTTIYADFKWMNLLLHPENLRISIHIPSVKLSEVNNG